MNGRNFNLILFLVVVLQCGTAIWRESVIRDNRELTRRAIEVATEAVDNTKVWRGLYESVRKENKKCKRPPPPPEEPAGGWSLPV